MENLEAVEVSHLSWMQPLEVELVEVEVEVEAEVPTLSNQPCKLTEPYTLVVMYRFQSSCFQLFLLNIKILLT